MHNKISRMEEKCHDEKLEKQIIKCLNCFSNSEIIQPSLHFLRQGIWKPIILCKFPQRLGTVFPLSVLHFAANTFYQYANKCIYI